MMFRPYVFAFSTFLLGLGCEASASDWTKTKNDIITAIGIHQTNNLYHVADATESSQHLQLGLQYDWLGLYEGFGIALPAKITSRHYREQTVLNDQDYVFSPALKLFLTEAADVTFETQWQRQQLLAGSGSAEFLDPAEQQAARDDLKRFALALQLGRQPDRQNLALRVGTERHRLQTLISSLPQLQHGLINELDSDFLQLDYGHRISENTSVLANAHLRKEQQLQIESDLQQIGAGVMQQWSGAQQLRVLAGYFQRDSQGLKNSGSFWQVENLWQLSQAWQLVLSSHRLSVLSYATNSVSQLDTTHQIKLGYVWSEPHVLTLQAGQRNSRLDGDALHRKRFEYSLGWDWQLHQYFASQLFVTRFEQQDNAGPERNRHEIFWQLNWLW